MLARISVGQVDRTSSRLLFVVGALIVFRLGTFIPVPGVNPAGDAAAHGQQQGTIVDMFNMFSGGALERFRMFALNVMPYISASIIVQLSRADLPEPAGLKKEGESGRRKLTQYTRSARLDWRVPGRSASRSRCRATGRAVS
jgi:preprotein translocase subunit SecY